MIRVKMTRTQVEEASDFYFTVEKSNTFRYVLAKFNKEGWANASKHKPIPFDLVTVLTDENKEKSAWWVEVLHKDKKIKTGYWEGIKIKPSDKVIKWKRRLYDWIKNY